MLCKKESRATQVKKNLLCHIKTILLSISTWYFLFLFIFRLRWRWKRTTYRLPEAAEMCLNSLLMSQQGEFFTSVPLHHKHQKMFIRCQFKLHFHWPSHGSDLFLNRELFVCVFSVEQSWKSRMKKKKKNRIGKCWQRRREGAEKWGIDGEIIKFVREWEV